MADSRFVYVTYIRTTPEKLWDALTKPEFTRLYWAGTYHDTTWEQGSSWKLKFEDGRVADSGLVIEIDKPRRLVLKWQNQFKPELNAEGYSTCTFELSPQGETVKLSIVHEIDKPESKLIQGVSGGWPKFISSLKSLLETGSPL
jgi:uncharacterized protein YndB with AHSA1/START domain